ncbi:hypothetical protein CFAM422_009949 [Trichoderma lentiforme]|uniref:Uncharacterized protein n=1 Tax=Trichoderma lentiforme TaxID=1567552 RepID=A0A9P4X8M3_9HYPO|nr:hypothetical protein CFAM422_009949 [Trichoderma lentiforme]
MASKATTPAPSPGMHPLQLLAGSPALPPSISSPASPSVVQAANLAHRRPNSEIAQIIRSVDEMRESVVEVREHQKYGNKRVSLVLKKVLEYSTEVAQYSTDVASYSDEVDGYRDEVDEYCQKVDASDKKIDKLSKEVGKLIDVVNKVRQDVTAYNQNVDQLSQKVDKVLEMNTRLGLWFDGSNTHTVEPTALDMSAPQVNSNGEVIAIDDDEQGAGDSLESVEQDGTYSTNYFDDAIDGSGDYGVYDMVR